MRRGGRSISLTDEQIAWAREGRRQYMQARRLYSMRAMADTLGCSVTTVQHALAQGYTAYRDRETSMAGPGRLQ
jgi:DNA-binding transcriptional MocR family regulator